MLTLIVSRLNEDLGWLHRLRLPCRVHVHNHGAALDPATLPDGVQVSAVPGGAAHSVLQHLRAGGVAIDAQGDPEGHTVFTTGQPFEAAPALLELLGDAHRWGDVQALSGRPDSAARPANRRDWIGLAPVQPVHYSLATWAPLDHDDDATRRHARQAREALGVAEGANLSAAFFHVCGLPQLAADAAQADLGVMAVGGIFAVRNRVLDAARARITHRLDTLRTLCLADPHYGWVLERSWLHLFGLPHVRLAAQPRPAEAAPALHGSLARVVASIDALLARAEQPARTEARARIEAPAALTPRAAAWTPELRARTQAALNAGDPDRAMALLVQAGEAAPVDAATLADAAAQALHLGELGHAVPLARRALQHDPSHTGARQTLATGLVAQAAAREQSREQSREQARGTAQVAVRVAVQVAAQGIAPGTAPRSARAFDPRSLDDVAEIPMPICKPADRPRWGGLN